MLRTRAVDVTGVTDDDDLLVVTLDRPDKRNALTREGLAALRDAFADADAPVVLLRGEGAAFCAGADLEVVESLTAEDAADFAAAGQRAARVVDEYDGAVVAGIDGPARGGGLDLALACDVRVCTHEGSFAASGIDHGLFGAWGGTARLPEIVGRGVAADLALSGRVLDAEDALRVGLVSRIVDDPQSVAEEIATKDASALRAVAGVLGSTGDREQERREREAFERLVYEREKH